MHRLYENLYIFYDMYMKICSSSIWHWRIRRILYNIIGMKINKAAIHCDCFFTGTKFSIGNGSYVNRRCTFDCQHASISIGERVGIAFNVQMYTTNHDYSSAKKRTGKAYGKNIVIHDGVWIGSDVIICPGVEIGEGAVIAAGSVVTKNCQDNCLYGGNPARLIKELDK